MITVIGFMILFSACATMKGNFEKARRTDNIRAYQEFLAKHPESEFSQQVKLRIEELEWGKAKKKNSIEAYEKYISKYPEGEFTAQARDKVNKLKVAKKNELEFNEKLSAVKSVDDLRSLIEQYKKYSFTSNAVPKLEAIIVNRIKTEGIGNRFSIKEITSQPGPNCVTGLEQNNSGEVFAFSDFNRARLGIINGNPNLFGDSSIHRFKGKVEIQGYTFIGEGDKFNRLTFCVIKDIGYVYLRGKGKVLLKDGKEASLGYGKENQVIAGSRVEYFKVFGQRGNDVIAADKRTKEFLEKAFKLGVLFPDPKFPGAIDFDATLFMNDDGRALLLEYFPSGKLKLKNIAKEEGKYIYSLPTAKPTNTELP